MSDFNSFIENASLVGMPIIGAEFTRSNMHHSSPIQCRLDRALISSSCLSVFPTCNAFAAPRLVSDHNPIQLTLSTDRGHSHRLFKFFNHETSHPDFLPIIARAWRYQVPGNPTFRFTKKLVNLKNHLRPWVKLAFGNTAERIDHCTASLTTIQNALESHPSCSALLQAEVNYKHQLLDLHWQEEKPAKQQSRIRWLKEGDANTGFFHAVIKARRARNLI